MIDITETQSNVTVTCMDETTYVGHLVIGADGAYSAVRQIMYKKLQEKGLLPEVDKKPLHFDKQCVVGKSRNGILPSFVVFVVFIYFIIRENIKRERKKKESTRHTQRQPVQERKEEEIEPKRRAGGARRGMSSMEEGRAHPTNTVYIPKKIKKCLG